MAKKKDLESDIDGMMADISSSTNRLAEVLEGVSPRGLAIVAGLRHAFPLMGESDDNWMSRLRGIHGPPLAEREQRILSWLLEVESRTHLQ